MKDKSPTAPLSKQFSPKGWIISDFSEKPLVVSWQGELQKSWNGTIIADTLNVSLNELSGHLNIRFIDSDKAIINVPDDNNLQLTWLIPDESMLQVIRHGTTDYLFHLRGLKTGTTYIKFQVVNQGNIITSTPDIPVVIKKDSSLGPPVGVLFTNEDNNEILSVSTLSSSSGEIGVSKDSLTEHIRIDFNDSNGKEFQPDNNLFSYKCLVSDSTIAQIIPVPDETWVIRIRGLKAGKTSFILSLYSSGVPQFVSAPVNISVK